MLLANDILFIRTGLALRKILGSDQFVETWWNSTNAAFDFKTPSEQWEIDPAKVMDYVFRNEPST
jgi:hypothetical protein